LVDARFRDNGRASDRGQRYSHVVGGVFCRNIICNRLRHIDGEDLASLLRRAGRLSREKTVQIAKELCAGLAAAHDHGVLHRDLKPSNIVIDGDGYVHIADFGIAAYIPTAAGEIPLAGTPAFMAPGLYRHQQPSKQSDLYALGIVLYEVATGTEPFDGIPADGLKALAEPIPPSVRCPDIEPALERQSCSVWTKIRTGGLNLQVLSRHSCQNKILNNRLIFRKGAKRL
jgi:serine/threonine protein kinase